MAFQFTCPQGHLLSAEESQAGQTCYCPQCHVAFVIPSPQPPSYPAASPPPQSGPSFAPPSPQPHPASPPSTIQFAPPSSFGPPQFAPASPIGQQPASAFIPPLAHPAAASMPTAPQAPPMTSAGMGITDDMLSELPQMPSISAPPGGAMPGAPGYSILSQPLPDPLHIPCPNGHPLETPHDMLGQHVMCPFCQAQFFLKLEESLEYKRRREMEQELADERSGRIWIRWAIGFAVLVVVGLIFLIGMTFRKP